MADTTRANIILLAPELEEYISNIAKKDLVVVTTVTSSVNYTVTINGTAFTIASGLLATALTIAAALVSAINLGTEPVTASNNGDGSIYLEADIAGDDFTSVVDSKMSLNTVEDNWVGEDIFDLVLSDVILEVEYDRYHEEEERAQRYLLAHLLTKMKELKDNPSAYDAGLQREKVGDVERWWYGGMQEYVKGSAYNTTKYGEVFVGIKQRYSLRFL